MHQYRTNHTFRPSTVCIVPMTRLATLASLKTTNPKPLGLPVSLSKLTKASSTSPNWEKYALRHRGGGGEGGGRGGYQGRAGREIAHDGVTFEDTYADMDPQ